MLLLIRRVRYAQTIIYYLFFLHILEFVVFVAIYLFLLDLCGFHLPTNYDYIYTFYVAL